MGSITECLYSEENISDTLLLNKNSNVMRRRNRSFSSSIHSKNIDKNDNIIANQGSDKRFHNINLPRNIEKFTCLELSDEIASILRIRIPFFNNIHLQSLSAISFITGNGPYHEGLIILTRLKNIYVTQIYPITFVKVNTIFDATKEIILFNSFNKNSNSFNISDIYIPRQTVSLNDIYDLVINYPNIYNMLNENCQKFCENIINNLARKFKIERDNNPKSNEIRFIEIIKSFKSKNGFKNIDKIGRRRKKKSFSELNDKNCEVIYNEKYFNEFEKNQKFKECQDLSGNNIINYDI